MANIPQFYPRVSSDQASFAGRSERMEINSFESMDAGLTIKTREGDVVTLTASRFSEIRAGEYNREGSLTTEDGRLSARQHVRQIQLASGESFSFSVQGDLNEQELADIENIISGVDGIISEMAEGDMEDAVALALAMGSYDSVAMYEADITVTRAYSAYAETRAVNQDLYPPARPELPKAGEKSLAPSSFMDEVGRLLAAQEEKALAYARQPLSRLFDHYLETMDEPADGPEAAKPAALILETAKRSVDLMIQEMVREIFESTLDQMI